MKNKCVMCDSKKQVIRNRNGDLVEIYFEDPKTKEQLCEKCNQVNDAIYFNRQSDLKGEIFVKPIH